MPISKIQERRHLLINLSTKIALAKQFEVNEIAGEKVMIDFESGKYFMIKGTGNVIFDMITDGITVSHIIESLMEKYDISEEICTKDTLSFLNDLYEKNIIKII